MCEPAVNKSTAEILAKPGDPTDKEQIRAKNSALFEAADDPLEKCKYALQMLLHRLLLDFFTRLFSS